MIINYTYTYDEDKKPHGFIIHYNIIPKFIISNFSDYDDEYIFCTEKTFDEILNSDKKEKFIKIDYERIEKEEELNNLLEKKDNESESESENENENENEIDKKENEENNEKLIKYLVKRNADYDYNGYLLRNIYLEKSRFNDKQLLLFKQVMKFYNSNKSVKVLIDGSIGSGKSYFAFLLAQKLKCYICDTFNPTEPSDSLSNLYTSKKITCQEPLIVLIDEIDTIIEKIHNKRIQRHKHYMIQVHDKLTWNSFMDKIDYGLFPNLILIMTSNTKKEDIDKIDPSYLRKGRIDVFSHF